MLTLSQEYTVYRETQHYHLDYLLSHVQQLLLEQGRRLVARSAFPRAQDIFHLTGDWLEKLPRPQGRSRTPSWLSMSSGPRPLGADGDKRPPPSSLT